jgi:sulfate transport system ATP-binding protein
VAFARALAPNPKLLLLDEPFAAIDAKVRLELRTWLRNMINRLGITSIFVTHDQDEAIEVADEIIVTNQGRIEQTGTPQQLYSNPETPFVAQFIGNSIRVDDYSKIKFFQQQGENSYAILRPEFIQVYKKNEHKQYASSAEEGTVEDIIFRGSSIEVKVRLHDLLLSAVRSVNDASVQVGEKVDVFVYRIYVVDGDKVTLQDNQSLGAETFVI